MQLKTAMGNVTNRDRMRNGDIRKIVGTFHQTYEDAENKMVRSSHENGDWTNYHSVPITIYDLNSGNEEDQESDVLQTSPRS